MRMKPRNKINDYLKVIILMLIVLLSINVAIAGEDATSKTTGWLGQLDIYAKVFGGVITGLGALFGLPITILHFKKTKAEIRKLELEAQALSNEETATRKSVGNYDIEIRGSHNKVKILADPRFLGPLLLLLDFIIAWIVLTITGYAIGLFIFGPIRIIVLLIVAGILLIPIFREAKRTRSILRPKDIPNENDT